MIAQDELTRLEDELAAQRQAAEEKEKERRLERYASDLRETFKAERARADELRGSYVATARALTNAVEARDAYTGKHAAASSIRAWSRPWARSPTRFWIASVRASPEATMASVLIVADDPFIHRLVSTTLEDVAGFEPVEAAGGAEALELARSEPPALVFLDIDMPGIDGYEVCRRMRARARGCGRLRGFLGLGSNVGDRLANLRAAREALAGRGIEVVGSSSAYETEPQGEVLDQPDFLNACLAIETELGPERAAEACKEMERELGREPGGVRHGPRPIDVDVLLLGDIELRSDERDAAAPRDHDRRFVLEPLLELEPGLTLPDGTSLRALLPRVTDQRVTRL